MKNGKKNGRKNGNGKVKHETHIDLILPSIWTSGTNTSPELIRQAMLDRAHVPEGSPKQNGSALIFRCAKCHALGIFENGVWFGTAFDHFCYPGSVDKRLERQPWTEADQKARDERLKMERAERIAAKRLP